MEYQARARTLSILDFQNLEGEEKDLRKNVKRVMEVIVGLLKSVWMKNRIGRGLG